MTQERLSYAYGTSSQPLLGMTIGEKFDQACQQYAEQDAVVSLHQNVRLTYKELQTQVNAFACSLLKLGLKKRRSTCDLVSELCGMDDYPVCCV